MIWGGPPPQESASSVLSLSQSQPPPPQPPAKCAVCGDLGDYQSATQTVGREDEDTWLPDAGSALKVVQAVRHPDRGKGELKQCPECGAWFFYRTSYEFLIPRSYDEQILIRLSGVEAESSGSKATRRCGDERRSRIL